MPVRRTQPRRASLAAAASISTNAVGGISREPIPA
jgi:hypothetical protein